MFGPSLWVVSSPNRYHTPSPSDAGASEAAKACKAPGPIEVNTAAFSPVTQRSAAAAWEASASCRTAKVRTTPASS